MSAASENGIPKHMDLNSALESEINSSGPFLIKRANKWHLSRNSALFPDFIAPRHFKNDLTKAQVQADRPATSLFVLEIIPMQMKDASKGT